MFLKKDLKNTLFFHLFVTIVIVYVKMNATKYGTSEDSDSLRKKNRHASFRGCVPIPFIICYL